MPRMDRLQSRRRDVAPDGSSEGARQTPYSAMLESSTNSRCVKKSSTWARSPVHGAVDHARRTGAPAEDSISVLNHLSHGHDVVRGPPSQ